MVFQDAVYPDAKYCYMAIATDASRTRKAALTTDLSCSGELGDRFHLDASGDWDDMRDTS